MKYLRRFALGMSILCLVFAMLVTNAESTWQKSYTTFLQSEGFGKTALNLCDFTGDGIPELIALALDSQKTGTLHIYTISGESVHSYTISTETSFAACKSITCQARQDSSGNGAVSILIQTNKYQHFMVYTAEGSSLENVYYSKKDSSGKQFWVNGSAVSKSIFSSSREKINSTWKLYLKSCPKVVIASKAQISSGMNSLAAKYNSLFQVKSIKLSKSSVTIVSGNSAQLKAKITPTYATSSLSWTSSNSAIAEVSDSGVITAKSAGSCKITCRSSNGKSAVCLVKVTAPAPVSVAFDETEYTVSKGGKITLSYSVTPSDAYKTATFASSNKKIATVSSKGVVTGKAGGEAVVKIKTKNGLTAQCRVTVVSGAESVSLNVSSKTLTAGDKLSLTAKVLPSGVSQSVTWSSSNPYIASVSNKGVVVAHRAGTAKITAATSNGKSATCTVKVESSGKSYIIDISQYNTVSDWDTLENYADLIILRATCGTVLDTKFKKYAAACVSHNIPFGVYCYGKATTAEEGAAEAQQLYSVAKAYNPLFYVYDIEKTCVTKTVATGFSKQLRQNGVNKVGYYISHNLYSTLKINTAEADFVWIPRYGKNTGEFDAAPNYSCDLHQYTSMGHVPGISTRVDLSRLTGSKPLAWFLS